MKKVLNLQNTAITLAEPRGICAGVERAIKIVNYVLEIYNPPIYVKNEIVHNQYVVKILKEKGVIFVKKLCEIPIGEIVIFSAHGVSNAVRIEAKNRKLKVFDATCPLVTKVHNAVIKFHHLEKEIIMIGHKNHPEVEGTLGQINNGKIHLVETPSDIDSLKVSNPENLAFVTQTTLSLDDSKIMSELLKKRFPKITGPRKGDDICYATQNRQEAVKMLTSFCDLILVIGSYNSSNSNRLWEIAKNADVITYLIDNESDIDPSWLLNKKHIGITAGASAPESLIDRVIDHLKHMGITSIKTLPGLKEKVRFPLPKELSIYPRNS